MKSTVSAEMRKISSMGNPTIAEARGIMAEEEGEMVKERRGWLGVSDRVGVWLNS